MLLFPIVSPPAIDPADPAEQRALVTLVRVPGVGPGRIRSLVAVMGSGQAVLAAPMRQLKAVDGVGRQTAEAILKFEDDGTIEKQFEAAERVDAELITMHDPRLPALLMQISDPPPLPWERGKPDPEDD